MQSAGRASRPAADASVRPQAWHVGVIAVCPNRLGLISSHLKEHKYVELTIDDVPLCQTFVGRLGAFSGLITPLGWSHSANREFVSRLMMQAPSPLLSGRVPVLVASCCGDIACGCIAVRITFEASTVKWGDWAIVLDSNLEEASVEGWKVRPGELEFLRAQYEEVLSQAVDMLG